MSFDEVKSVAEKAGARLWKNGEMTIYDTSQRIGMFLGHEPDRVYLHRGTREGAKALGFKGQLAFILPSQLPRAFRKLKPSEIEDCLCIYRDEIAKLRALSM